MKYFTRLIALLLCLLWLPCTAFAAETSDLDSLVAETAYGLSSMSGEPGTLLANQELFPAGTSGCDWAAHALALSGSTEYFAEYLSALEDYVGNQYAENGCLHEIKATEYHRVSLVVLALGGDPTCFGIKPDGTPIDLIAEGTYNFVGEELGLQGLNGWIWALIALDASGVEVPADAKYQRADMVAAILAAQEPEGGFGLIPGSSDVDITAMALQALSPYKSQYPDAIDAALNWLCTQMSEECTYSYYGAENAESISQVIIALCALGIDPEDETGFVRGENTLLTALNRFRQEDGTYAHLLEDDKGDSLATSQAMQALLSVQGLRRGQGYVFAYRGVNVPNQNQTPYKAPVNGDSADKDTGSSKIGGSAGGNSSLPVIVSIAAGAVAVIAIIAIIIIVGKRKKHG